MSTTALAEHLDADTVKIAVEALREIAAAEVDRNGNVPDPQTRLAAAQTLVGYATQF